MATEMGIVGKAGTWFTYGEARLGQGRENAKQYLENNPELMDEIEARIRGNEPKKAVALETEQVEH